ncbi:lipoyl synthase [Anaerocellum danielii]|uniref:Lipoyl synthase n=1 Tax=Anaerocellum danielii TaxID=1387557 RepID=A0ABZ0U179_9FIRM|nr:lipoyl synthase [Caldicellulosiruptor danielii]WPX09477.1 lipoyl synthase [Caldicellulosiruptor danielii]
MSYAKKPDWLRIRIKSNQKIDDVLEILKRFSLHTVCEQAQCPNIYECFSRKTATFLIMGDVCTRNCTFCDVKKGNPKELSTDEPGMVAEAVAALGLEYVVITSVTRDDLEDGGASHFAQCIRSIKGKSPHTKIEILIPDFKGNFESVLKVTQALPDVVAHNIETIERLYPCVRPLADYKRSLNVLRMVKEIDKNVFTKSGIMVGLGETKDEVKGVLEDLRKAECDFVTIGQYLSPSKNHHPVFEFVHPDVFEEYKEFAISIGFKFVMSGPLVRSSYMAENAKDIIESIRRI